MSNNKLSELTFSEKDPKWIGILKVFIIIGTIILVIIGLNVSYFLSTTTVLDFSGYTETVLNGETYFLTLLVTIFSSLFFLVAGMAHVNLLYNVNEIRRSVSK